MVDREHVWEVTTAHGTRIVLDRGEESRWMRIPAIKGDGRLNLQPLDGRWRRLWTTYPIDEAARRGRFDIELGKPLRIYIGISEWWDTTAVVALRSLSAHEVPSQLAREDIRAAAGCRLMAKAYAAVSVRSLAATAQLAASSSCAPRCGWSRSLR